MPRTTLNIDSTVLQALRRRQREVGKSLGELASELLARELAETTTHPRQAEPLDWISRPMRAKVDLEDKDALHAALDAS